MSDKKYFRGAYDSDSEEDSTSSSSTSDSDTSDDSTSSSSSSSSSEAVGMAKWMKGGKADSDSEEEKRAKVLSKKDKNLEALIKQKESIVNHLANKDFSALLDDLDALTKLKQKATRQNEGPPNPFIGAVKRLQEFFEENPKSEVKAKLKNKAQEKNFSMLARKANSLFAEFEEALKAYESEEEEESEESSDDWDPDASSSEEEKPKKQKKKGKKGVEEEEKKEEEWNEELIEQKIQDIQEARGRKGTDNKDLVQRLKVILAHTEEWRHMTLYVLSVLLSIQLEASPPGMSLPANTWRASYECVTRMLNLLYEHPDIIAVDSEDDERRIKGASEPRNSCFEKIEKDGKVSYKVYIMSGFAPIVDLLGDEYIKALQLTDTYTQTHEYVARLVDEGYLVDAAERVFAYYKSQGKNDRATRMALRLIDHLYYRRNPDHQSMMKKQRQLCFEEDGKKKVAGKDEPPSPKTEEPAAAEKTEGEEGEAGEEGEKEEKGEKEEIDVDQKVASLEAQLDLRARRPKFWAIGEKDSLTDVMKTLHGFILKNGDDPQKTKALLCYIYHLALHGQYWKARDLLLMSRRNAEHDEHVRFVNNATLMILYNRVIAQLGLASFRVGEYYDTNALLNELLATGRVREYLAQALVKNRDQPEKERNQERAKLVPFHMHINVDMLEATHLIAAMLQDVPLRAQWPHDTKRRPHSKAFARLLAQFAAQVFIGPPESTKELIYAAFLALQKGEWEKANTLLMSMNLWNVMPNAEEVKAKLTDQVKLVGLRTYLFTFSQYYTTVQLGELAVKYGMDESRVHAVISKMILRQQITAAWDQPKKCICVEHNGVTKLQFLATQMAEKCTYLVEYNEQRQVEKEARQGGREYGGYQQRRRQGGRWDRARGSHHYGLAKSRQIEKKKESNPFERKTWKTHSNTRRP